jgi:hypothetical protein
MEDELHKRMSFKQHDMRHTQYVMCVGIVMTCGARSFVEPTCTKFTLFSFVSQISLFTYNEHY